ncbi:unnamed protein product [Cercopithifilaria johnstoni]|uniref:Nose resistant-to-fluoxetine protein N-terminal domain-containing protein n=1 Tax=Cercopithifilaria johnstoni TaxID=2874296 RepID=A0A8J2M474_9BILA|nr:unnamed protein product [Cercopithifilaria johnstoni]
MDECIMDFTELIVSTANALLMRTYCRLADPNQTKISHCLDDTQLTFHQYLPQVLDAWGRPSAGIYSSGPFFWLGDYDQCQSISKTITTNYSVQYCRANIRIEAYGMQQHQIIPLFYGMCLPIRCNERSINNIFPILSSFLERTFGILISNNSAIECFKQKDSFFNKLNIEQWIILAILAFLVILVLCGTLIDIYRKRRNRKYLVNKESSESCSHMTIRPMTNISSQMSSICTPYVQDDARSFIYSDVPSQALTYKSIPAVRRTLKKSSCFVNSILAFSIRSTYHYLIRPRNRHLNSLHGIRVLSAFWVVIGHAHLFSLEYIGNVRQLWSLLKANEKLSLIIFNSSLSVDSFLLISAAVLAYKVHLRLLKQKQRKNEQTALSPFGWLMLWFHRFIRLMPAYIITFLIIYFVFQQIGDGPMWSEQNGIFGARCNKDDIWRQMLFLTNFYPNECMPWMWYLALDTQFYIIAPIVLLLLHIIPTIAIILIIAIIVLSVIYRATMVVLFRFPATLISALIENDSLTTELMEKMFRYLYAVPHARIGSFLIGILLGWSLSTKSKRTYSTIQIIIAHFLSFLMLAFSFIGANYANDFNIFSIFYAATFRVVWTFGLAIFVWLCERGYMHMIHSFLAWEKWTVFSRLSYGFYLSHEPILLYFIWTKRSPMMPLSAYYFIIFAMEISMLSLLAASLIAFIIEIPPLIIERKIFKTIRTRIASNKTDDETKQNDMDNKSVIQLFCQHKNDEIIELTTPMISPMKRTKRWIEENHEDLRTSFIQPNNTIINKSFCASKSSIAVTPKTTRQFPNIVGNTEDIVHPSGTNMEKQYNGSPKVDKLVKQKEKIPMKRNHDKEVSLMESIGFSWIEEIRKKLNTERNTRSQFPYNKGRRIMQYDGTNQQQQQHFNLYPLDEQISTSNKSTSSTNTGETVSYYNL